MASSSDKFKAISAAMKRHLKGKVPSAEVDAFLEKHRPTLERKIREARAGRSEQLPRKDAVLKINRPKVRKYNEFEFAERASRFTVDTREGMWLVVVYKSNLVEVINPDDVVSATRQWHEIYNLGDSSEAATSWLLEHWPPYEGWDAEEVSIVHGWDARMMEGSVPVTEWHTGIDDDEEEAIDDLKGTYNITYEELVWPTELRIGDMVKFKSPPDWVEVTGLALGEWRENVFVDVRAGGDNMSRNEQVRVRLPRPKTKPPLLTKGFTKLKAPPKQWDMKRDTFELRADNVVRGDILVTGPTTAFVVKSRKVDGDHVDLTFTNGMIDPFRLDEKLTLLVSAD